MEWQKSMADFASYRSRCIILKPINSTPKQILLQRGFQRGNLTLYEAKSAMDFGQWALKEQILPVWSKICHGLIKIHGRFCFKDETIPWMKQNLPWIFVILWQILFHTGQVLPIKAFFRQFSNSIGGCLQFSMGLTVTYYHHFLPFSKDYKNFRRFSIDFCNFPGNSKSVTHFPRDCLSFSKVDFRQFSKVDFRQKYVFPKKLCTNLSVNLE